MDILINSLLEETGIDARIVYCSVTGKPIANLTDNSIDDLLSSLPNSDEDDKLSELLTRTLAASRTSPAWTLIRADTIAHQFTRDLPSVLTYLLSRLWEPTKRQGRLTQSLEDRNYHAMKRITTHQQLCNPMLESVKLKLETLGLCLLEIDSKYNLTRYDCPLDIPETLDLGLDWGKLDLLITQVQKFADKLNKQREQALKHKAESDRSFMAGNSTTKQAYMQEFIRQTPPSENRQAVIKKQARLSSIWDMFDELESATKANPNPAPKRKPLIRQLSVIATQQVVTGASIRFGKKEASL